MKVEKLSYHTVRLADSLIDFNRELEINNIEIFHDKICISTRPTDKDLDWNIIETHNIWKKRCEKLIGTLYCYDYNGALIWELKNKNVIGFGRINVDQKKLTDFINLESYNNYRNRFYGLELIEAYIGGWPADERVIIDVATGKILDTSFSK